MSLIKLVFDPFFSRLAQEALLKEKNLTSTVDISRDQNQPFELELACNTAVIVNKGDQWDSCTVQMSNEANGNSAYVFGEVRNGHYFFLNPRYAKPQDTCKLKVLSCTFWKPSFCFQVFLEKVCS